MLQTDQYLDPLQDLGLSLDPMTGDRTLYAGGNPINMVDEDGHRPTHGGSRSQERKLARDYYTGSGGYSGKGAPAAARSSSEAYHGCYNCWSRSPGKRGPIQSNDRARSNYAVQRYKGAGEEQAAKRVKALATYVDRIGTIVDIASMPFGGPIKSAGLHGGRRALTSQVDEALGDAGKLGPNPNAVGRHSTYVPGQGGPTKFSTWSPNSRNPSGWDLDGRFDAFGGSHFNKVTGQEVFTPHLHGFGSRGGVQSAGRNGLPTG